MLESPKYYTELYCHLAKTVSNIFTLEENIIPNYFLTTIELSAFGHMFRYNMKFGITKVIPNSVTDKVYPLILHE